MAQSLFKVLQQRQPKAGIDVLAPRWSAPLLRRMPEVDEVIDAPFHHGRADLRRRYQLGQRLRASRYEWAIVLPNSWKSALVPFWARIPRRTGYVGEHRWGLVNDIRHLDQHHRSMTVQRFVALAHADRQTVPARTSIPAPELVVPRRNTEAALSAMHLSVPDAPLLVLCPGAEFGPAKQWPVEHFGQVARAYLDQDWSVWLLGSDSDADAAKKIHELCAARCVNIAGQTTLEQVIDLMSLATLVISNDSGLMHIAAGLGRPLVGIYGSSDPSMTPPLSSNSAVVSLGLPCSPCFKRKCPLGHLKCLRELTPERVEESARRVLHELNAISGASYMHL